MQVSSSVNSPLTSGISNVPSAPIKNSVRSAESVSELEQSQSSSKSTTQQTVPSIVIDEQAVALYQQSQLSAQLPVQSKYESASSASQDQPSAKNETAIASYQAVGNLAKRESVQQLFGVDLFA